MITKYNQYLELVKEESGIRNINKLIDDHKNLTNSNDFEIWFHQDLDGVTSALAMKSFLEKRGMTMVDCHIIQYGGMEYAIKNKRPNSMAVLVDFAHFKTMFTIGTDHHTSQSGMVSGSSNTKPTRSNVETISGEISPFDIFTSGDIELVKTVDSANFLKYNINPDDLQNSIFLINPKLSAEKNRFMMGFVVNRLLLVFKNKRINVKSLDGKRDHINRNLLECLVLDCNPSLISMYVTIKHYMDNALSLEWDRAQRKHNVPKKLATSEEIIDNLNKYIKSRVNNREVLFDPKYKIVSQYGIGYVMDSGSYDRYVVFKNNPDADFVCTVFPMGLIQVSCNPFKEKVLKNIDLGAITIELLNRYKTTLSNIFISISDIKRMNEDEITKMKTKYGSDYNPIGFTFDDIKAFYKDKLQYLPNRKSGDMKTKAIINLMNDQDPVVIEIFNCMNKPYASWSDWERQEMSWIKVDVFSIIRVNSGGHPSITNIQGLNYLGTRSELLKRVFSEALRTQLNYNNVENIEYMDIMKLLAHEFLNILRSKIDSINVGNQVFYQNSDIELKGGITTESFEYYLKSKNGDMRSVTKDEFIKIGFNKKLEPKNREGKFVLDISNNKIIGKFE